MKIVITGTHLSPSLAVASELKNRDYEILFIGRKYALEGDDAVSFDYKTIKDLGYEFEDLTTGRLQRKWTRYTIVSLLKIPIGFLQGFSMLINFRPDIIISFGGYVSLPVTTSGFFLGIPVVIHEQTTGGGLANKVSALWARKVLISWRSSQKSFPKDKTILTGNPVREEILNSQLFPRSGIPLRGTILNSQIKDINLPIIYITGGSLGSHTINVTIEKIIDRLLKDYIIIHQTGDARQYLDFDRFRKLRENLSPAFKKRYILTKFVDSSSIGWVLNNADLIIGRAGVNTVSELLVLKKRAVLIPLPFAQDSEQLTNAKILKKTGLAEIIPQDKLNSNKLYKLIKSILDEEKSKIIKNTVSNTQGRSAIRKILQVILYEIKRIEKRKENK